MNNLLNVTFLISYLMTTLFSNENRLQPGGFSQLFEVQPPQPLPPKHLITYLCWDRWSWRRSGYSLQSAALMPWAIIQFWDSNFEDKSCLSHTLPSYLSSTKNNPAFLTEFSKLLSSTVLDYDKFIIVGDFNFRINDSSNYNSKAFLNVTESYNLVQHVKHSIHNQGRTLKLVFTLGKNVISHGPFHVRS